MFKWCLYIENRPQTILSFHWKWDEKKKGFVVIRIFSIVEFIFGWMFCLYVILTLKKINKRKRRNASWLLFLWAEILFFFFCSCSSSGSLQHRVVHRLKPIRLYLFTVFLWPRVNCSSLIWITKNSKNKEVLNCLCSFFLILFSWNSCIVRVPTAFPSENLNRER